jgi:hypothetical protein
VLNRSIPAVPASAQDAGRVSFDQAIKSTLESVVDAVNGTSEAAAAAAAQTNTSTILDALWELDDWDETPSGGTADQPALLTYAKDDREVTATLTWGAAGGEDGNITEVVFAANDTDRTRTLTIAYDADGYVTSKTWS